MSVRPTNAWFANLIYDTGRLMVAPLPYHVKVTTNGLDVCLPTLDSTSFATAVIATFTSNLSLRSTGGASATQKVTGFTDLGCTVAWSGGMTADLVRGMAYATMRYTGVTPVVSTIHAVTAVNGTTVGATGTFTGSKFKLALDNGQTWIVYFSSSVTLTLSASQVLTAGASFTGTVRAAFLSADSGAEAALDASAACIPTGGTVAMSLSSAPTGYSIGYAAGYTAAAAAASASATYTKTLTWATTGTGTLLTYAMPHHQDTLVSPTYAAGTVTTLRGSLRAVTGSTWTLGIPVPTVGWDNRSAIDSTKLSAVTSALANDKVFVPTVADPYFGGKSLAKAGRLTCIANVVGDTAARGTLLGNLRTVLNSYLAGGLSTKLRYDTVWGGVVSEAGLTDGSVDFGNGRYNDHYFHYGYTIYAAAVVARFDPNWLTATNVARINDLVRDICNPSTADPYFTTFRHFDHYEGHSWASGSPEATDGRNQESTSEAVNAWYGVQQWGVVSGQANVASLGAMLMAEEILTARKYWQVKQAGTVYPASTFKSKGVVGILWSGKVDHGTWFSAAEECIFGIQALPTNPTTEALVDPAWAAEVWTNNLASVYAGAQESWKGPLVGIRATSDPVDAWTKVQALTAWDDGTSKTQMLYHVATQTVASAPTPLIRGLNIMGGEFGALPGTFGTDYNYPSQAQFDAVYARGNRVVRLPFRWERIQPTRSTALDATGLTRLTDAVTRAGNSGLKVILDPHNYARFTSSGGTEHILGSTSLSQADFVDFWVRMSSVFATNTTVWAYGLMNEPHDIVAATGKTEAQTWQDISQAVVSAIRATGDTQRILVPGYSWSSARFWTDSHPTPWIADSAGKTVYEAHYYPDVANAGTSFSYSAAVTDATSRGYASVAARATDELNNFTDWCTSKGVAGFLGETGWPNSVDTTSWNAVGEAIYDVLDAAGVGATYWASSAYGDYDLAPYQGASLGTVLPPATIIEAHLTPGVTPPTNGGGGGGGTASPITPVGSTSDYQSAQVTTAATTWTTGTRPAGMALADGDVLVMVVGYNGFEAPSGFTVPAGWTTALPQQVSSQVGLSVLYRVVPSAAAEPATYTITASASARAAVGIRAYRYVDTATPMDVTPVRLNDAGGATPYTYTSSSITTATAGAFAVSAMAILASTLTSVTVTKPSGNIMDLAGRRTFYAEEGVRATVGAAPGSSWVDTSTASIAAMIAHFALRPANAGSTGGGGGGTTAATPVLLSRVVGVDSGVKVRTTDATSVRIKASTDSAGTAGVVYSSATTPDSNGVAYPKFASGSLTSGTRYYYRVAMTDTNGVEILDSESVIGRIRKAPVGATNFAFNFGSCTNATDSASMAAIAARGDDLFFHLGDLWYLPSGSEPGPTDLGSYMTQMGAKVGVANHKAVFVSTASVFAPSDHDFSMNNNGNNGTTPSATPSYNAAYRRLLPTPTGMPTTTGVYYPFTWGRVLFLNLDCRSFASAPSATDNSSKTLLGSVQKQWLKDQITNSTAAVICLIGDTAWTGAAVAGDDAWIGFTTERAELAGFFTASGKNICYLSGDMHAVGADNGSAPNNPGSLVTFAAAPLNNNSSQKVSGWSAGIYPSSGTSVVQQYGRIAVTDDGTNVTFAYTGYSSDNTARITMSKTWSSASTGGGGGGSSTGPVGPSGTWVQVFDDEFNGTSVDSSKWASNWFGGNNLNHTAENPANITFPGDGTCTMQVNNNALADPANGVAAGDAAGCLLTSNPNNGGGIGAGFWAQVGDYAEARISFPGSGSTIYGWPAWWTDGESWPNDGEIDIFEGLGTATSNYHSPAGANNSGTIAGTWSNSFHTYGAHRKASSVDIYWDGNLVRSYTTSDSGARHYLLLTNGPRNSERGATSNMKVDWVRVWRPA